jgi:hypothetical protein
MKTAVEWLFERLERMIPRTALYNIDKEDYFNQAKAMEKEQMNHIVDTNKMVSDKVLFEQATVAMEEHYGYGCETEIDAYFRGAKWMQKQFIKNTEQ